jgi:NHLM bacteriocin system ABC transporter peptidase/ATP-binding protein
VAEASEQTTGAELGPGSASRRFRRRARTPTLLQMEAVECGAAALGIVLGHYGRFVALEQLRRECGVSRDGSNAASVLRAARAHGMEAKGFQMETDVARTVATPFIVFWNFNHFMVIERMGRRSIRVNDPGSGPRRISFEEFDDAFTGVVLAMRPGPDFERGGRPQNTLREVATRLRGNGPAVALALFTSLLLAVMGLALPGFQRVFIDNVLTGGVRSWLWPLIGLAVLATLILMWLTLLQQRFLLRMETKMSIRTSAAFLGHLLRLPIEFFGQRQPSDLANRVESGDRIAQLLSRDLATAVASALVAFVFAILLVETDAELAAIGIGLSLLNLLALRLVARLRRDASRKLGQDRGKLIAATYNGIAMIETLKASGREDDYFARWSGLLATAVSGAQRLGIPAQIISVVPPFLAMVNTALILLIGGHRALHGAITIGLLVAFQLLLANFARPVSDLSDLGTRLQEATADIARLRDVERYPERPVPRPGSSPVGRRRLSGHLELREVCFGYSPLVDPLIQDFSLRLTPGRRVALVGPSGSGKSTIARLVAGVLEPWSGEVRFDGVPRGELPPAVLAASLGFVDQDLFLFEGTVRENLTLWDPSLETRALLRALRDAELYQEIMDRPEHLDTVLSEDGRDLSGGQRQRLELARALAGSPTMLVLDEATSALDARIEERVLENLRRRGCACLIVAHRLSTVRDCDEILVMDGGQVVERGTHEEMKGAGGPYSRLVRGL